MKTKLMKLVSLVLVLVLVCGCLAGCGKKEEPSNTETTTKAAQQSSDKKEEDKKEEPAGLKEVKIAVIGPMTGDNAQYGTQFKNGVSLAIEEYNAKGGMQVAAEFFDDKNDAKEAVSIASKVMADGGYCAIIGPFSSTCALAMAEVTDEEKLITISPSCSHVDYVKLYDYTFRLSHVNAYEGQVAANEQQNRFGATKVASIYSNNDWGISLNEAYVNHAKSIGLEVVAAESFIQGQTKDFSSAITKIKQSGAESLYYMGQYTECAMVLKQIQDLGLDIDVIITTSAYKTESLTLAGDAAKDVVFMTAFVMDESDPVMVEWAKKIKDKYNANVDNFVLRAYDATNWLIAALEKCGTTDSDTLRQAIIDVGAAGIDGMGGDFTLNSERNVERLFFMCEWNGKYDDEANFQIIKD